MYYGNYITACLLSWIIRRFFFIIYGRYFWIYIHIFYVAKAHLMIKRNNVLFSFVMEAETKVSVHEIKNPLQIYKFPETGSKTPSKIMSSFYFGSRSNFWPLRISHVWFFFLCFSTPVTAEWKFPDVVAVHCGILIWVACGIWSFISLACRNLATIAIADTGGYCLEDIDFRMLWLLSYQYHHSENKYEYY